MVRHSFDPPHAQYPGIWELGESGPQGVYDYGRWLLADEERFLSAAQHMRYLKIGMHFLTAAQIFDENGDVSKKLEINLWAEEHPPEVGAGGHAHARAPELYSFIHPDARQTVSGLQLLPRTARRLPGLPIKEGLLVILNKIDLGDGLGTIYDPLVLDSCLALRYDAELPTGARQKFSSLFVHEVGYKGPGVGVTVQIQGPSEQAALNTFEGFVNYKGLDEDQAARVVESRDNVVSRLKTDTGKLIASTVLVRDGDFTPNQMETTAQPIPIDRAERLIRGGIYTQEALGARIAS